LARASVTVAFMCPIMSFWATVIFKHPGVEFIPVWLQTFVCNFPMAFFWQIFFCGPLVRFIFRMIFERKSRTEVCTTEEYGQQSFAFTQIAFALLFVRTPFLFII